MGRYKEHGIWRTAPGIPWVPKTRLQLATEQKDIALQNLVACSERLGSAQKEYRDAMAAESLCLCKPSQCTNCGGK